MDIMKLSCRKRYSGLILIGLLCGGMGDVYAHDAFYPPSSGGIKQLHDNVNELRYHLTAQEDELRQIGEKFNNTESTLEDMQRRFQEQSKGHAEQLRSSKAGLETKLGDLELVTKGLVLDVNQIKNRVNESSTILQQYKQQLASFEKAIEEQNRNIENMHAAIKSLMQALQGNEGETSLFDVYTVKSGDSLEKIAHAHSTSVKALKELNNLPTDRIKIGQKLKIPTK